MDSVSPRAHQYRRKVSEALPGFDGMMNVDEVDKIHGSRHITTNAITSPDPPTLDSLVIDQDEEMTLLPSLSRQRDPSSSEEKNRLPDPLAPPIKEEEEEQMILLPSTLELTTAIPYDEVASSSAGQQEIQNDFGTRTPELSFSPPPVVTSSPSQLVSSPELLRTPPSHPIPSIPHSTHTTHASSPESMPVALSPDLSFSPSKRRRVPSSPELPNSPGSVRKRSHMHLPTPGSFIKASVEMLKGVSSISGPMAV